MNINMLNANIFQWWYNYLEVWLVYLALAWLGFEVFCYFHGSVSFSHFQDNNSRNICSYMNKFPFCHLLRQNISTNDNEHVLTWRFDQKIMEWLNWNVVIVFILPPRLSQEQNKDYLHSYEQIMIRLHPSPNISSLIQVCYCCTVFLRKRKWVTCYRKS